MDSKLSPASFKQSALLSEIPNSEDCIPRGGYKLKRLGYKPWVFMLPFVCGETKGELRQAFSEHPFTFQFTT